MVTTEVHGRALWLTVDRPEALNAINGEVMEGLEAGLERAREDPDLRVVVLRGAGDRAFISGGDLREFAPLTTEDDAREMAGRMRRILEAFEALDCFTIGCVNGDAYGGGCETLVALDLRIAADDVRLGWTQTKFEVPPGWGGLTRLVELVGPSTTLAWLGEARPIPAPEALAAGALDEVVARGALEARVQERAERLSRQRREMIAVLKRGVRDALRLPREASMAQELGPFAACWASQEHHEAVRRFLGRSQGSHDA